MADTRDAFVKALVDLDETTSIDLLKKRIASKENPMQILEDIRKATDTVGKRFEEGRYFVSDLMMAGEILSQAMGLLKPVFGEHKVASKGTILVGTVEGDVHDIGKNIVSALLEAEGYTVIDIGVDQPPAVFIKAIQENHPKVVSMSGLLTEAIESMKKTVDAIKAAGLRSQVKIIIGGGRCDEEAREHTGADDWADDAAVGVRKIKLLAGA